MIACVWAYDVGRAREKEPRIYDVSWMNKIQMKSRKKNIIDDTIKSTFEKKRYIVCWTTIKEKKWKPEIHIFNTQTHSLEHTNEMYMMANACLNTLYSHFRCVMHTNFVFVIISFSATLLSLSRSLSRLIYF